MTNEEYDKIRQVMYNDVVYDLIKNSEDMWPEVASLFTGIIGTQQWKGAIEKAKQKYIIIKK